jgi:ATP-dependent protease ClpP protease subunit
MFKNVLTCILLAALIAVAGIVGYTSLDPVMNAAPAVITLTDRCEVADNIAYRLVVSRIDISDPVSLYREIRDLKRLGINEVHFYINSPGGSLFDALAVHDAIKRLSNDGIITIADIEGGCMSAAVVIASACAYRTASPNCEFMVHCISGGKGKELELFNRKYAEILAGNSNLSAEEWLAKMKAVTWFSSEEALEWGLIDEIR